MAFSAGLLCLCLASCGGGSSGRSESTPLPLSEFITITTGSNVQCIISVPFTLTLQAQGNSGPLTWTITSGQLPTGLSLDASSGTISGTPTANNSSVTIRAADGKGSGSKQFVFSLWDKLVISPVSPAAAHVNAAYTQSINGQGSTIVSWEISTGQLPPGLSLAVSSSNVDVAIISGTPTQAGTFNFSIQAQDSFPQFATLSASIVVDNHLTIIKSNLKSGGQNQSYLDSFSAVNGTPPLLWTISGDFPGGISLNAASGQVTGIPANFGRFPYSVSVTDSSASVQSDSGQGILNIVQQMQIVGALDPPHIGEQYNSSYSVIGGSYPYTWTLASGSLPPGLQLTTAGSIIGTPTQLGASSFVLQITDSGSPPYVLSQPATLNVVPTVLNIPGSPISPAPVNVLYHSQIPGSGGTPPYAWNVTSGQLPAGINLDSTTGFLNGTPIQIGTYNFTVTETDSGIPQQTTTGNEFIQVVQGLGRNDSIATATPLGNSAVIPVPLIFSISPYIDPINAATPNPDTDFYKLVGSGGSLVHVETFANSYLLDTVLEILDANGQRYALCSAPSYNSPCLNDDKSASSLDSALDFKVPGSSASQTTFYAHILDWRGDARPDFVYYLNISGVVEPLRISPTTLGLGATRGANYNQQFTAQGGTGNVTWSLAGGSLPPGWSISSSGLLRGVATADGSYTFIIQAIDSAQPPQTRRAQFSLLIAEPLHVITPAVWPNACVNQPYSFTVGTSGGLPPIQFGFISDRWIAINLNQSTGTFSGTTTVLGTFTGTVGAADSAQPPSGDRQDVSLTVVTCP